MDLLKKNITIVEATFDGTKVKVKDQDGVGYTFFAKKQSGEESVAYKFWKTLESNGKGVVVIIGYNETQGVYQGNPVTYRSIATMSYGPKQSLSQTVAQVKYHEVKKTEEDDKWDNVARGKCRFGFALEAFKNGMTLSNELASEINKWVEYSMTGEVEVIKDEFGDKIKDLPF